MALKVLVVDDDPASLRLIRPLSAGLSHAVLTSASCQQAAERVQSERIDLAFLGMGTAQPDSLVVVPSIRNSRLNREAIVVMLSATDEIETLRSAFEEGADLVLTKPVHANRIRAVLAAIESSGWKGRRKAPMPLFSDVKCVWDGQQVSARSLNISETGTLLQPMIDAEVGREIELSVADVGGHLGGPSPDRAQIRDTKLRRGIH